MGNHKFRLSDMMPTAWFYKFRDTSKHASNHHKKKDKEKKKKKKKKQQQQQQNATLQNPRRTPPRKSYYYTRTPAHDHFNSISHSKSSSIDSDPPMPSIKTSSSSSQFKYLHGPDRSDVAPPPPTPSPVEWELRSDRALPTESFEEKVSWSSSSDYEPRNIVIDIDETKQLAAKIENSDDFVTIFDLELRPILTKPKLADTRKSQNNTEIERRQSVSKGMKMRRASSPRINNTRRKSLSSSSNKSALAIVKRSKNPKEDFKQSMVEMIVEHEIRSSNDLEELLACYLSLNSDEYHDLIISVFKQIWFQLSSNKKKMRSRPAPIDKINP